jgi:inner membrane protein
MSPGTHLLVSWVVAQAPGLDKRGRWAVTLAGIVPDLDGLGVVVDLATRGTAHPTSLFADWHHQLSHNALAALVCAGLAWAWCRRSWTVAALVLVTFHLHFLCDILGSRGPDGHDWPIPYLLPFADVQWRWSGQWALNSWQNLTVTAAALVAAGWFAWKRGFSCFEWWPRADAIVVARLRGWFGQPRSDRADG